MNWWVINDGAHKESLHHALDEVLLRRISKKDIPPTLRFWHRKNSAVPIGRFQSVTDEVNEAYAQTQNIDVVRRITGGGAMFLEPNDAITYSLYLPRDLVSSNVEESYAECDSFAVKALRTLGLNVKYAPLNDIEHTDGKVAGAAQLRKGKGVLHHTAMSYNMNTERMLKVLRIGKEKLSDKAIKSAEKRVTRIKDYTSASRDEVIDALIESFSTGKDVTRVSLPEDLLSEAKRLAKEKFEDDDWTYCM